MMSIGEAEQTISEFKHEHKFVRRLRKLGNGLLSVGGVFACILMVCLFVVGFGLIFIAIWKHRRDILTPDSRHITVGVLHGLEFFFLAPLPALVFLSLSRFFRSFQTSDKDQYSPIKESNCAHQLHRVKAL